MRAAEVSEAIVLMAGAGSRLHSEERGLPKPLIPILGRPLITYILEALEEAGIKTVYAVVGFESEVVRQEVTRLAPSGLEIRCLENPDWHKQNGVSVLAAAQQVQAPFLLTMSDHLFEQAILDRLLGDAAPNELNLAVDRKLASIFDLADAMKVQTVGDRMVSLGKTLATYDAIDTGLFLCPAELFEYLRRAQCEGDCSLADGVQLMAADGKVRAIDIGAAWWQDVDTPEMLASAERKLRSRDHDSIPANSSPA